MQATDDERIWTEICQFLGLNLEIELDHLLLEEEDVEMEDVDGMDFANENNLVDFNALRELGGRDLLRFLRKLLHRNKVAVFGRELRSLEEYAAEAVVRHSDHYTHSKDDRSPSIIGSVVLPEAYTEAIMKVLKRNKDYRGPDSIYYWRLCYQILNRRMRTIDTSIVDALALDPVHGVDKGTYLDYALEICSDVVEAQIHYYLLINRFESPLERLRRWKYLQRLTIHSVDLTEEHVDVLQRSCPNVIYLKCWLDSRVTIAVAQHLSEFKQLEELRVEKRQGTFEPLFVVSLAGQIPSLKYFKCGAPLLNSYAPLRNFVQIYAEQYPGKAICLTETPCTVDIRTLAIGWPRGLEVDHVKLKYQDGCNWETNLQHFQGGTKLHIWLRSEVRDVPDFLRFLSFVGATTRKLQIRKAGDSSTPIVDCSLEDIFDCCPDLEGIHTSGPFLSSGQLSVQALHQLKRFEIPFLENQHKEEFLRTVLLGAVNIEKLCIFRTIFPGITWTNHIKNYPNILRRLKQISFFCAEQDLNKENINNIATHLLIRAPLLESVQIYQRQEVFNPDAFNTRDWLDAFLELVCVDVKVSKYTKDKRSSTLMHSILEIGLMHSSNSFAWMSKYLILQYNESSRKIEAYNFAGKCRLCTDLVIE